MHTVAEKSFPRIEFKSDSDALEFCSFRGATKDTMSSVHWSHHVVVFSTRAGASRAAIDWWLQRRLIAYRAGERVVDAVSTVLTCSRALEESRESCDFGTRESFKRSLRANEDARAAQGLPPARMTINYK